MDFKEYRYEPERFWNTLDETRERLGIRKYDLSRILGKKESYYASSLTHGSDMKLSTAYKLSSAVGLTLDEAFRGETKGVFVRFLEEQSIDLGKLPEDSLLRTYPHKALIPTFFRACSVCRDSNVVDIVSYCLKTDVQHLFMYFFKTSYGYAESRVYDWMGPDPRDFNDLRYDYESMPNILQQFWQGGVKRSFGMAVGFDKALKPRGKEIQEFSERLGLPAAQMYKYLQGMDDNTTKVVAEPKLSRIADICNALSMNIDDMVEPIYSIDRWVGGYESSYRDHDNEFDLWHDRFFINFRNIFRALPLLQAVIDNYRLMRYPVNKNEKRDHMADMARDV